MKRLIALIMVVFSMAVMAMGCTEGTQPNNTPPTAPQLSALEQENAANPDGITLSIAIPTPTAPQLSALEQEKAANPDGITLSIAIPFYSYYNSNSDTKWMDDVFVTFKKQYPYVDYEFISCGYEIRDKIIKRTNLGQRTDIMFISGNDFPGELWNYVQPLQNYIDIANPDLKLRMMDINFQYNSNYYVAACDATFLYIHYNKELFAQAGLEDPLELYNSGQWNWENFAEINREMTAYLSRNPQLHDKNVGTHSFDNFWPYVYLGINNTSFLTIDASGKYQLNMNDPALKQALEYYQQIRNDTLFFKGAHNSASPTCAMECSNLIDSYSDRIINGTRENIVTVPLPSGQSNPDGAQMFIPQGYAIGSNATAPAHAGKLIDMLVSGYAAHQAEKNATLSAENVALLQKLEQGKLIPVNASTTIIGFGLDLFREINPNGDTCLSVEEAIEKYIPIYQQKVDAINKGR